MAISWRKDAREAGRRRSFLFYLLVYIFVMYVWSRDEITQSKTGLL